MNALSATTRYFKQAVKVFREIKGQRGNGGLVTTRPEKASVFSRGLHSSTVGGNRVLRVNLEKEQRCAEAVGSKYLLQGLHKLKDKHDIIGDVRGRGLMIGVELVKDRCTKESAKEETADLYENMKDSGVSVGKGGLDGNIFKIKLPMCFHKKGADFLVDVIDYTMSKMVAARSSPVGYSE